MKKLFTIAILLQLGCAADPPRDEHNPLEGRVIGTGPMGLPVVDSETMPFPDDMRPEIATQSQAVTTEPFYGTDEWGWGVAPFRLDNCNFRATASHSTTVGNGGQYGDPGEGTSRYYIQNRWVDRRLGISQTSGSLNWSINFPAGSPCNEFRCTIWVCIESGTQFPRCISSHDPRGATQEFDNDYWPAQSWKTFLLAYWADYGPGFPTSTTLPPHFEYGRGEDLIIKHTCL